MVRLLVSPRIVRSPRSQMMSNRSVFHPRPCPLIVPVFVLVGFALMAACTTAVSKNSTGAEPRSPAVKSETANTDTSSKGATIPIRAEGPADTVRVFYKHLREKKFREAIFLTNLRPAVEGLTDTELKEFALDFEALAGQIPAEIEINGEIVTGDLATVTANLPNADGDKKEIQTIKLRRENGIWVIMTADDEAAKKIRQDGKNYFFNLRVETHEQEARNMLERISKAQLVHSLQNDGLFTDIPTLVAAGLLPEDIKTSESTGYVYVINLAANKKQYFATATPVVYGKSGKLSFLLQPDSKGVSRVTSKDTAGKPMQK